MVSGGFNRDDLSQSYEHRDCEVNRNRLHHSKKYCKTICFYLFLVSILSGCGSHLGREQLRGEWITVVKGDHVSKLASQYRVSLDDIIEINGIRDPSLIHVGQRLFIPHFARDLSGNPLNPVDEPIDVSTSTPTTTDLSQLPGIKALKGLSIQTARQIRWPLTLSLKRGVALSSGFGMRNDKLHKGIDIRAPIGTPVRAVLRGEVIRSEYSKGGYGWVVYIKHAGGLETRYAHHKSNLVRVGQVIEAGAELGLIGSSGRSTGSHLHFEMRIRGEAVDPLVFLPAIP